MVEQLIDGALVKPESPAPADRRAGIDGADSDTNSPSAAAAAGQREGGLASGRIFRYLGDRLLPSFRDPRARFALPRLPGSAVWGHVSPSAPARLDNPAKPFDFQAALIDR